MRSKCPDIGKSMVHQDPSDEFLVLGVRGGDEVALSKLMDRYDRLVRYTVFRLARGFCHRDPSWLDGVASSVWMGLVLGIRRDAATARQSLSGYLVRIARNRTVSAIKSEEPSDATASLDDDLAAAIASGIAEPATIAGDLERLETLRSCLEALPEDDRTLVSQLDAIANRRWCDAAAALGTKESTLRSHWARVVHKIKRHFDAQESDFVAPSMQTDDVNI